MKLQDRNCRLCITGTPDFVRRMNSAVRQYETYGQSTNVFVSTANLAETKSIVLTERPDILVFDIGLKTTSRDISWMREILEHLRERLGKDVYIILAATSPERFALAGDLFFLDELSLEPSGFIDNMIISSPHGISSTLTLEEQLCDCLTYVIEGAEARENNHFELPALWDENWVPVMCDPESRNIWMRWLPRYAHYINENPLIVGPTGAGKTRLAAALHTLSGRKGAFISITPRDFSSNELIQAELFGAVAGAYTGAVEKWGLVKQAEGGTLFIDELQSIDLDLQGKLITFIENKTYRRVGEAESHEADVRFVFATNRSLQQLVTSGNLRDDFAYRLERLQMVLSPLQNRRLDIGAAVCFALGKILRERRQAAEKDTKAQNQNKESQLTGLTAGAYQALFSSSWPGNLRQLENTVAKLVELADIKNSTLIDRECTSGTMKDMLGHTDIQAADIFEKAAINAALLARTDGFEDIEDFTFRVSDNARFAALDVAAGDPKAAAQLINDSERVMELFLESRRTEG